MYTWGVGNCGQLGHGDVEGKAIPTQVMALKEKVGVQVTAGHAHTMVLTKVRNKLNRLKREKSNFSLFFLLLIG